jgi:hypothetical protein
VEVPGKGVYVSIRYKQLEVLKIIGDIDACRAFAILLNENLTTGLNSMPKPIINANPKD